MTLEWTKSYDLFLFDFDGLLVDTERLHYQAYIDMCKYYGCTLNWSFERYSKAAHHSSSALKEQIYAEFPALKQAFPLWETLYRKKQRLFLNLLQNKPVPLMPGVEELLLSLEDQNKKRAVVTHSAISLIEAVCRHNLVLNTIPNWITREDYNCAKPNSECYQLTLKRFAKPTDVIIGFEDSPRGFKALHGSGVKSILICPEDSDYLPQMQNEYKDLTYFPTFIELGNRL